MDKTIERSEESILAAKRHDRVWVTFAGSVRSKESIMTVTDSNFQFVFVSTYKFHRHKSKRIAIGDCVGSSTTRLLRIATPEECEIWDKAQKEKIDKRNTQEAERESRQTLLKELTALFDDHIRVAESEWYPGRLCIIIDDLAESAVRGIKFSYF